MEGDSKKARPHKSCTMAKVLTNGDPINSDNLPTRFERPLSQSDQENQKYRVKAALSKAQRELEVYAKRITKLEAELENCARVQNSLRERESGLRWLIPWP